jgi:hypothetical protein
MRRTDSCFGNDPCPALRSPERPAIPSADAVIAYCLAHGLDPYCVHARITVYRLLRARWNQHLQASGPLAVQSINKHLVTRYENEVRVLVRRSAA